jgi:hypothetical protein
MWDMFHNCSRVRHPSANTKGILNGIDSEMPKVLVMDLDEFEGILKAGGYDNILRLRVVSVDVPIQDFSVN